MSEAALKPSKTKYNGKYKKRNWEARAIDTTEQIQETEEKKPKIDRKERIKRRKYALLLGYSGVNYFGMQRNPGMKTIEEDLHIALHKCKLIDDIAFNQIQNIQFQRAARTDKGVSAVRQVCSLKLRKLLNHLTPPHMCLQIKLAFLTAPAPLWPKRTYCSALVNLLLRSHHCGHVQNSKFYSPRTYAEAGVYWLKHFHNFRFSGNI